MKDKVMLKVYHSDMKLSLAQIKLAEAGIESWTLDKRDSTILTTALTLAGIQLYVESDHATRALDILGEEE